MGTKEMLILVSEITKANKTDTGKITALEIIH